MRKSILILACSLFVSSLSAMSFTDDVTIIVQDDYKEQWHETQPNHKSFDFLVQDHFIATPTILQDVPQIPFPEVSEIKVVELWNYQIPK